jgi:acyl-coenzyme A synthetase/AMP-(fatty) acid ligase
MDLFYKDSLKNQYITKNQFLKDLKAINTFNPYCRSDDFYQIFLQIIYSLLIDEHIILLDNDFTNDELKSLVGFSNLEQFRKSLNQNPVDTFTSIDQVIEKVKNTGDEWKITLFTSGTTGLPKKVSHIFSNLTRFVKTSDKHKKAIWGFAYHPTHIAGLQVFFQAFLNSNPLIRLFQLSPEAICKEIDQQRITHLSATPTFYRMLLGQKGCFESVARLTSGGEKYDEKTLSDLQKMFPNATITNVYASTEAGSIFASDEKDFIVKPAMKPYIKIYHGTLYLHKELLGETELLSLHGDWYETGDMVEILQDEPLKFRFISRKNEMINVGGFKVNPLEVEETIRKIKGIKDAKVYSKKNAILGHVVCSDLILPMDSL